MRTNQISALILLSTSLIFTQCSSDKATRHTFSVEDIDGVPTALTRGGPRFSDELFAYEKILELRPAPANEESYLVRPVAVTMGSDGRYYVADSRDNRIAVFNAQGGYERSIGQSGSGPGDLQRPREAWILGERLHVRHGGLVPRVTIFGLDGRLIDVVTVTIPVGDSQFGARLPFFHLAGDGTRILGRYRTSDDGLHVFTSAQVELVSSAGDTLAVLATDPVLEARIEKVPAGGHEVMLAIDQLFTGFPCVTFAPDDRILVTTGLEPIIECFDVHGILQRRILIEMPSEPVSDEERTETLDLLDDRVAEADRESGSDSVNSGLWRGRRQYSFIPAEKAWWRSIYRDDAGYLWLQIPGSDGLFSGRNHAFRYRLFSPGGEYLGDTLLHDSLTGIGSGSSVVRGYLLLLVIDEETGERIPTIYKIRPAVEGLVYP